MPPAVAKPTAPPMLSCGSTGLVPGVDCLPAAVPSQPRFYGDVSYMLTTVKNGSSPGPLAIVAPTPGALFGPGTATVLGGQDIKYDGQNGVRADVGMWFGCDAKIGIEAGGFVLDQVANGTTVSANGGATNPILARPFLNLNATPATPNALIVGGPGLAGAIAERDTTRLWRGGQRRAELARRMSPARGFAGRVHLHRSARNARRHQHLDVPGRRRYRRLQLHRSPTQSIPATSSMPARSALAPLGHSAS